MTDNEKVGFEILLGLPDKDRECLNLLTHESWNDWHLWGFTPADCNKGYSANSISISTETSCISIQSAVIQLGDGDAFRLAFKMSQLGEGRVLDIPLVRKKVGDDDLDVGSNPTLFLIWHTDVAYGMAPLSPDVHSPDALMIVGNGRVVTVSAMEIPAALCVSFDLHYISNFLRTCTKVEVYSPETRLKAT